MTRHTRQRGKLAYVLACQWQGAQAPTMAHVIHGLKVMGAHIAPRFLPLPWRDTVAMVELRGGAA